MAFSLKKEVTLVFRRKVMKLTRKQLDDLIRVAKGKRAVEKLVAQSKRFHYERYLLADGSLLSP